MEKYREILKLARETINASLSGRELKVSENLKKKYSEEKACFVTLTINGNLRGCIGSLEARQALWKDVLENSINAAFSDPRFEPLTSEEFKKVKIEISVLTVPKKIEYESIEDLKKKIDGRGVILKMGRNSATYLPQVWEELADAEEFLSSLCLKAGLPQDSFKTAKLDVWIYDVDKVAE